MLSKLFISGLFRSGTTFLARALNTHPSIILASDPFFEFFKNIRNQHFKESVINFDQNQPLQDYFYQDKNHYQDFQDVLSLITVNPPSEELKQRIIIASQPYSPKISTEIDRLKGGSLKNSLDSLFTTAEAAYPKTNPSVIGIKEVWTDEFIPPLLENGIKCIQIIRDPRAIIASNKKSDTGAYPILFLARQWRKSVAIHIENQGKKNYLGIKYEDLITEPKKSFQAICAFLDIEFNQELLRPEKYKDGADKDWEQNSSHGTSKVINKEYIDRWKEALSAEDINVIEWLCEPEMNYMNYLAKTGIKMNFDTYSENEKNIADWIKKYKYDLSEFEVEKEVLRKNYLSSNENQDEFYKFFLTEKTYRTLKNAAEL